MHLKRLEITGFKSFADNVKLDFEPGITAVVGPNGCGKSNIMDAVRWCLGEMSAKSLRSSMMLDVVFNGSGSRPPQNMAEVTLTFDNGDKRLPIDFDDVAITRRLFRSGESEYYINKTQCRLRDIKELFLDTGMGEDGYSCLEQGKVEWILQAKPEERRELFEEAAGVSKYRARREEALRKLDRVEIDLSRLADIVSVTQDQIRKLENAVQKAKTYQKIKDELRVMEIGDWLHQLTTGADETALLTETLASLGRESEELNTRLHQADTALTENRVEMTRTEEELLAANNVLSAIDADARIAEERQTSARQRQADIERQMTDLQETIARDRARVAEIEAQRSAQAAELEALKADGAGIEAEFQQAQLSFNTALASLEEKKAEAKQLRDLILERGQERARLQQQAGQFSSDAARLESRMESLEKEKARSAEEIAEAQRSRQTVQSDLVRWQEAVQTLESGLTASHEKETSLLEAEKSTRARILADSEVIAQLRGQIQSIQESSTQDPYLAGSQALASSGLPGLHGPLARLIQCAQSDRDLVAAALGEHLGDMIAETNDDALRAVQYLKDTQKGRARVWVLEKVSAPSAENPLAQLPGGDPLIQRLQIDARFRAVLVAVAGSSIVSGGTVFARAIINGGVEPSAWQSHVTHRLPEMEKDLSERMADKQASEALLAQTELERKEASTRRETASRELQEARLRLQFARQEDEKLLQRFKIVEERQQLVEMDLAQVQEDRVKAQFSLEQCQSRFQDLQNQEKENHDQLDLRQQELTELQQMHARMNAELSGKSERHKVFTDKVSWQSSVIERLSQEAAQVASALKRHDESTTRLTADRSAATSLEEQARHAIEEALSKRSGAADECSRIQARRVQLAEDIRAKELALSETRSALNVVNEKLQAERLREASLKLRVETLTQKLQEQYELTVDAAKAQYQPAQAEVESLERLKKRVGNMGPINLAAPQEYDELVEKNKFLTTQQEDLLKAKDDLKQVIAKINSTTREHFRETFFKVKENFQRLYGDLFQGGQADLRFTDEADILNTGIDIFCQPPGKKLLHISLLSGGEKALTAIALLFAFFQVRPSPVALLDEVDAPLDEANVVRYADMIKKFSEKSQFLLISHNKRTMEAANTLYGVTMEEFGVSKVLSARLAAKQAAELADAKPASREPAQA